MIIKKVKKVTNDQHVKRVFIFSFSLLQYCTSIVEFESIFTNMLHVFTSVKKDNTVISSLNSLKKLIRKRSPSNFDYIDFDGSETIEESEREKNKCLLRLSDSNSIQTIKAIKQSSH